MLAIIFAVVLLHVAIVGWVFGLRALIREMME